MQNVYPFNDFVRDNRPLSAALSHKVASLRRALDELTNSEELRAFADGLANRVSDVAVEPPRLGAVRAASRKTGFGGAPRQDGSKPSVTRHFFAVQVLGDPDLITTWPSSGDGLTTADSERDAFIGEGERVWTLNIVAMDEGSDQEWAIYTHFDLTREQEQEVAERRLELQPFLEARLAIVRPIVERIADETRQFFDEDLPARVTEAVERLHREFTAREAVSQTFSFPGEWSYAPPRLAPSPSSSSGSTPSTRSPVALPYVARLDPASFGRLQRTIRVWADAVERYPGAFGPLPEDRISDLLAATLRATLPAADREVFSRKGKTDILVHANVLEDGAEPAVVFIIENKKATSEKVIREAVDPQLFGYLNASDTAAVLLVILGQKNRKSAEARYLKALQGLVGYKSISDSAVRGWPLLEYRADGRTLRVCVAFVHLPTK